MGMDRQCHAPAALPLDGDGSSMPCPSRSMGMVINSMPRPLCPQRRALVPIVGGRIYVGNALQQNSELGNLQVYRLTW
jgi:hypothetical protein